MNDILRFCSHVSAIQDPHLQAFKIVGWLHETSPDVSFPTLFGSLLLARQGHPEARLVFRPLLFTKAIAELLTVDQRQLFAVAARERGYFLLQCLFSDLAPIAEEPEATSFVVPDVRPRTRDNRKKDPITLGERRSLAKSRDIRILEKMIFDPDPRVIAFLLDNPLIVEKHVLQITSRRPNRSMILTTISGHRKWGSNPRVRLSLALNPYAPPLHAMLGILPSSDHNLRQIIDDENLHHTLRHFARELIEAHSIEQEQ